MAYISAEQTRQIKKNLKKEFPNVKFSVTNHNFTSVSVRIMESDIDFSDIMSGCSGVGGEMSINHYHLYNYGKHEPMFRKIVDIINVGNHNNSRPEIDYFDVGWYIHLNIGKWDKPYKKI